MLRLREVVRYAGVPARTLERWADRGFLLPRRISQRSHRRFTADDVVRAAFLRSVCEEGVSLERAHAALGRFESRLAAFHGETSAIQSESLAD